MNSAGKEKEERPNARDEQKKKRRKGAVNREQYGDRKKIEKKEEGREEAKGEASEKRGESLAHDGGKYGIPVSECHHLSRGRDRARRYSGTF